MSFMIIIFSVISMSIVAYLLGMGLVFSSKKFAVEKDERITKIENVLPQTNCGACGIPGGCGGYAQGIVEQGLDINLCKPGGESAIEAIAKVLGMDFNADFEKADARVHCKSDNSTALLKYEYNGIDDCIQASTLFGGQKVCPYACYGLGSCIRACPFDAITISKDRVVRIIDEKCTACGKCVEICPSQVIHLISSKMKVYNGCSSVDKGGEVRKYCTVGCIGCMRCQKVCPADAVHVVNFNAVFDSSKCINCNKCFESCPTGCIRSYIEPTSLQDLEPSEKAAKEEEEKIESGK